MHSAFAFRMRTGMSAERQIHEEECYNDSIAENGKRGAYRYAD